MKSLDELIDSSKSTWLLLKDWISKATNNAEILAVNQLKAGSVLYNLHVSKKSILGTVAYFTGGTMLENGWLRILGGGSSRLPRNLTSWNGFNLDGKISRLNASMLIADDAVGGFFALNGGAFEGKQGEVYYFVPDTLEWEGMDMQYSDFLKWACKDDMSTVDIPEGLGQVIKPSWEIAPVKRAAIIPNSKSGTLKTAYPVSDTFKLKE